MIRLDYDNEIGECDLARADDGGIAEGRELETAVLISFFTNRRVGADEVPPGVDRGGWWGDAFPDDDFPDDEPIGSRLWLLEAHGRSAPDILVRARAYAIEALEWMITDGIATAVDATATHRADGGIRITVAITLPDGTRRTYEVPDAL